MKATLFTALLAAPLATALPFGLFTTRDAPATPSLDFTEIIQLVQRAPGNGSYPHVSAVLGVADELREKIDAGDLDLDSAIDAALSHLSNETDFDGLTQDGIKALKLVAATQDLNELTGRMLDSGSRLVARQEKSGLRNRIMKGVAEAGLGVVKQVISAVDMNELARQGLDAAEAAAIGHKFNGSVSGVLGKAFEKIDLKSVLKAIIGAALGR